MHHTASMHVLHTVQAPVMLYYSSVSAVKQIAQ